MGVMTEDEEILQGLDLLGDWLDAKGYTEEAGLCTRAMDEINKLREERHELKNELAKWVHYWRDKDANALRVENERLRDGVRSTIQERDVLSGENWELRAENEKLRAALKPFADDYGDYSDGMWSDLDYIQVSVGDLRAAAAALKETGNE